MANSIKAWVEIAAYLAAAVSALAAAASAVFAMLIYRRNARLERAKWAASLYEKFFESSRYKPVRDALDCAETGADAAAVARLVEDETPAFTDYLNFFELVAFLVESKQIAHGDAMGLFQYYLESLARHSRVRAYIGDKAKGFEKLSWLLHGIEN